MENIKPLTREEQLEYIINFLENEIVLNQKRLEFAKIELKRIREEKPEGRKK